MDDSCQGAMCRCVGVTMDDGTGQTEFVCPPRFPPGITKHWLGAAMLPLWTPCVHKSSHSVGTSRRTASPCDPLPPLVRRPSRTARTIQNIGRISGREMVTPEACNQHWWRTSVHSPPLSECDRVLH